MENRNILITGMSTACYFIFEHLIGEPLSFKLKPSMPGIANIEVHYDNIEKIVFYMQGEKYTEQDRIENCMKKVWANWIESHFNIEKMEIYFPCQKLKNGISLSLIMGVKNSENIYEAANKANAIIYPIDYGHANSGFTHQDVLFELNRHGIAPLLVVCGMPSSAGQFKLEREERIKKYCNKYLLDDLSPIFLDCEEKMLKLEEIITTKLCDYR